MPVSPVGWTNTELQDWFNYVEELLYRAEVETGQQGGDSTWSPRPWPSPWLLPVPLEGQEN